jgi:F0F1-type ATP synthase alpha subunit
LRPAINTGLSVTRVGTVGHNDRQKDQNKEVTKTLTAYEEAKSFAQFGSEVSAAGKVDLVKGDRLREMFTQVPGETYTLIEQQLLIDIVLTADTESPLEIDQIKQAVKTASAEIKKDEDFDGVLAKLKAQFAPAKAAEPAPADAAAAPGSTAPATAPAAPAPAAAQPAAVAAEPAPAAKGGK